MEFSKRLLFFVCLVFISGSLAEQADLTLQELIKFYNEKIKIEEEKKTALSDRVNILIKENNDLKKELSGSIRKTSLGIGVAGAFLVFCAWLVLSKTQIDAHPENARSRTKG